MSHSNEAFFNISKKNQLKSMKKIKNFLSRFAQFNLVINVSFKWRVFQHFIGKSNQKYEKSQEFSFALRAVQFGDKRLIQMEGFLTFRRKIHSKI